MSIENLHNVSNVQIVVNLDDLRQIVRDLINIERAENYQERKNEIETLSIDEVVALCKVDKSTLWRWDKCGYLPKQHCGKRVFYRGEDVFNLINNKKRI